jgi:hypothetical protein
MQYLSGTGLVHVFRLTSFKTTVTTCVNNHYSCFGRSKSDDGEWACPRNVVHYVSTHIMLKIQTSMSSNIIIST